MRLYNSMTRTREEFKPLGDEVLMYVCGVTVYDKPHMGHALSSIVFDVLHRYLEYRGYKVRRAQNFTDVDDKIINRAKQEGLSSEEVAEKNVRAFFDAMDALNVRRATVHPRATEDMDEIIGMISSLLDMGAAYEAGGSVYFRVRSDPDYGKLSRRTIDEMLEGTRFEVDELKEDPADFALWKASKEGEPAWDSPWGKGRPGWHIECSAMVLKHLGKQIDIHGGGLDLIFPHHENELAQSETALGVEPFVQVWMHNGMVRRAGDEDMSKSLGNVVNVEDVVREYSSDAVRLWVLQSHYRSPTVLSGDSFSRAESSLRTLRAAHRVAPDSHSEEMLDASIFEQQFVEAMDDDLNTPRAVAVMFELAHAINRGHSSGMNVSNAVLLLDEFASVLGLTLEEPLVAVSDGGISEADVEELLAERASARAEKRWADADALRYRLQEAGIAITDGPEGTTWSRT